MNSTETAAAEARLDLRIATASPGPYFFNPDIAAVALSLAQALRTKGDVVEDKGWHLRECALAFDWSHYQIESPCTCEPDRDALADWDRVLAEIASGRDAYADCEVPE